MSSLRVQGQAEDAHRTAHGTNAQREDLQAGARLTGVVNAVTVDVVVRARRWPNRWHIGERGNRENPDRLLSRSVHVSTTIAKGYSESGGKDMRACVRAWYVHVGVCVRRVIEKIGACRKRVEMIWGAEDGALENEANSATRRSKLIEDDEM